MALSSSQLEAFLAVAQTLNFTRAAEALHITQSALSQRVMNLERELETSLFIRDRAGLRLTEAALQLVRYCRCKNSLEAEYLADLKDQELAGVVRIGGFSSVIDSVIMPSISPLFAAHPRLKLHITVDEMSRLPFLLHRGEIDYMVLDHRESRDDLERVLIGKEKNVMVQKRRYKGPDVYLDHNENDTFTRDYLKLAGKKAKGKERRYLDNVYGLIAGVRSGLGRAVLPRHLIRDEKEFEILDPDTILEIPVYLYFYTQPYYSKTHVQVVAAIARNSAVLLD